MNCIKLRNSFLVFYFYFMPGMKNKKKMCCFKNHIDTIYLLIDWLIYLAFVTSNQSYICIILLVFMVESVHRQEDQSSSKVFCMTIPWLEFGKATSTSENKHKIPENGELFSRTSSRKASGEPNQMRSTVHSVKLHFKIWCPHTLRRRVQWTDHHGPRCSKHCGLSAPRRTPARVFQPAMNILNGSKPHNVTFHLHLQLCLYLSLGCQPSHCRQLLRAFFLPRPRRTLTFCLRTDDTRPRKDGCRGAGTRRAVGGWGAPWSDHLRATITQSAQCMYLE